MFELTQEYVLSILSYDPMTGLFVWKANSSKTKFWNSKYADKQAGSIFTSQHGKQYIRIKFLGSNYLAHRLAWFIVKGEWPKDQIDHWDENGLNNKWNNLREATQAQNFANRGSLLRGIDPFPNGKWRAKICINGNQTHLGMFDTKDEAYNAYQQALIEVHGDFAIYNRR